MADIKDVALRFIANRDHTVFEMKEHLKKKDYDENQIDIAIKMLIEFNYLNDNEYSKKYFKYSAQKGKGLYRIKSELLNKGVDSVVVDNAIENEYDELGELINSEYERALMQAKKTIANQEMNEKLKGKVCRRLNTLGFSTDIIMKVINKIQIKED